MQRRQEFKKVEAQEKNAAELKKLKGEAVQKALNQELGDATEEMGEKRWHALLDQGADINEIEDFFEPTGLTAGEKKMRGMSPAYARQQMYKDVEIGTQKTREYIAKIVKQNQKQKNFKDLVFKEEAADPMTDRIIKAINQPGTGTYNLDLIKKGASK